MGRGGRRRGGVSRRVLGWVDHLVKGGGGWVGELGMGMSMSMSMRMKVALRYTMQ